MATFYSNTSVAYRLKLELTEDSQDATNNKTKLRYKLYMENTDSNYSYQSISPPDRFKIYIDGSEVYNQTTAINPALGSLSSRLIVNDTVWVTHTSDGSKTISFSFSRSEGYNSSYSPGTLSGSGNLTLTKIGTASEPSFSGGTTLTPGVAKSVTWTRSNSSYKHDVWYKLQGGSWVQFASNADTSCTLTLPSNLASSYPTYTSITGSLCLETKTSSSGSKIGERYIYFTVNLPNGAIPTISSITLTEQNSTIRAWGLSGYVKGKSSVKVSVSATGVSGSAISSYRITFGSSSATGNNSVFTPMSAGTVVVTATVTDAYGKTASSSQNVTVFDYSPPKVTTFKIERCDSSGNIKPSGEYVKVTYNYSISNVGDKNAKEFKVQMLNNGSWTNKLSLTTYTGSASSKLSGTVGANVQFRAYIKDSFTEFYVNGGTSSAFELVSFYKNGIALGKVCETDKKFECDLSATFNKTVSFGNTVYMSSSLSVSSTSTFDSNVTVKGGLYVGTYSDPQTLFYAKLNGVSLLTALNCNSMNLNSVNAITAATYKTTYGGTTYTGKTYTDNEHCYLMLNWDDYTSSGRKYIVNPTYIQCKIVNGLICPY